MIYKLNPLTGNLDLTDPMEIGKEVFGGTPDSVMFIDPSGNLGEDNPAFTYTSVAGLILEPAGDTALTANKDIVLKENRKLYFDGG